METTLLREPLAKKSKHSFNILQIISFRFACPEIVIPRNDDVQ